MTNYQLPAIRDNRSDATAPTIRQGRDYPQARDTPEGAALAFAVLWPVILPLACAEFSAAVGINCTQAWEMAFGRRT